MNNLTLEEHMAASQKCGANRYEIGRSLISAYCQRKKDKGQWIAGTTSDNIAHLADEFTPTECRLWGLRQGFTGEALEKIVGRAGRKEP